MFSLFMITYYIFCFFFFNDTATTEIYTLSLHDALPIYHWRHSPKRSKNSTVRSSITLRQRQIEFRPNRSSSSTPISNRSEEHTSELQSQSNLVCRLLLEKKKKITNDRSDHCTCICH